MGRWKLKHRRQVIMSQGRCTSGQHWENRSLFFANVFLLLSLFWFFFFFFCPHDKTSKLPTLFQLQYMPCLNMMKLGICFHRFLQVFWESEVSMYQGFVLRLPGQLPNTFPSARLYKVLKIACPITWVPIWLAMKAGKITEEFFSVAFRAVTDLI